MLLRVSQFVNTFFAVFFFFSRFVKKYKKTGAEQCPLLSLLAEADAEHLAQQGEQITARTARKHGVDLLVRIRLDQGHA